MVAYLRGQRDVALVYLFGSYARQQAGAQSALDIALLLDEQGRLPFDLLERRLDLTARAEEIVGGAVDVVLLNRASLLLQGQVLGEGRLLYAADKTTQVEYEVRTRTLYFDFQHRLRQRRAALLKAAREGTLDRRVIIERVQRLHSCINELRDLQDEITSDVYRRDKFKRKFIERTLQTALEACLDIGNRLISVAGLHQPGNNRDVFLILTAADILPEEKRGAFQQMAGFRNILVHEYAQLG